MLNSANVEKKRLSNNAEKKTKKMAWGAALVWMLSL